MVAYEQCAYSSRQVYPQIGGCPMQVILVLLLIIGIVVGLLELRQALRPYSPLLIRALSWELNEQKQGLEANGWFEIYNPHHRMEVMVPEFAAKPVLLGKSGIDQIKIITRITPEHSDEETRSDNYWPAYIVKSKKSTRVRVELLLDDNDSGSINTNLENIWVDIHWVNYGPFGRLNRRYGVVVPLKKPEPLKPSEIYFKRGQNSQLLPIKTHMLGPLDDALEVLRHYAAHLLNPGDVITIGETPLAIMQGRYQHPSSIKVDWLPRILCSAFHPTSSLATACGIQALINLVGPTRVIIAWLAGIGLKLIGIKGGFYRLAGPQARLIDDITGTTPPYDQTIVLGPSDPEAFCNRASKDLGIAVAIVDVNDLGRVKVLAASKKCDKSLVKKALRTNPAGNANEQTPLVLVRPC